jgi:hypothetical protein
MYMTGQEMVTEYKRLTAYTTDMSDSEILSALDRKYQAILNADMWEFLRKTVSGTSASDGTITVPSDFNEFMYNWNDDPSIEEPSMKVVITNGFPLPIKTMSARNSISTGNFCWLEGTTIKQSTPIASAAYSFDYKYYPAAISAGSQTALPSGYDMLIVYDAVLIDDAMQKSEGRPYYDVYAAERNKLLSSLRSRNGRAVFTA